MEIQYSKHALERMIERGISKRAVKEALIRGRKSTADGGSYMTTFGTKNITVVYNIAGVKKYLIKTTYYGNGN